MQAKLTPEEESKDMFFRKLAELAEAMIAAHGKDFTMGALVLAARWIAENRLRADVGAPAPAPAGGGGVAQ